MVVQDIEHLSGQFHGVSPSDLVQRPGMLGKVSPADVVRALEYLCSPEVALLERQFEWFPDLADDPSRVELPVPVSLEEIREAEASGYLMDNAGRAVHDWRDRVHVRYVLAADAPAR